VVLKHFRVKCDGHAHTLTVLKNVMFGFDTSLPLTHRHWLDESPHQLIVETRDLSWILTQEDKLHASIDLLQVKSPSSWRSHPFNLNQMQRARFTYVGLRQSFRESVVNRDVLQPIQPIQGGPKKVSHYRESSLNRIKKSSTRLDLSPILIIK